MGLGDIILFLVIVMIGLVIAGYFGAFDDYDQDCLERTARVYCSQEGLRFVEVKPYIPVLSDTTFVCNDARKPGYEVNKFLDEEKEECES